MSFFDKLFGDSKPKDTNGVQIQWTQLTDLQQLDELAVESMQRPVFIFKHSTRCNISRMAIKQFELHYKIDEKSVTAYYLDILEHREISNAIADKFNVVHQSPQLLLVKNGECVYTTSHSEIDAEDLEKKISGTQAC